MISYSWSEQAVVKRIRQGIDAHGMMTWMDINGGMSVDVRAVPLPCIQI